MDINSLKNDPKLKNIDAAKLDILAEVLSKAGDKSKNELLPYFMAAAKQADSMGMSFSNEETDLIMEILTKDMSDAEKKRINYIRKLAAMVSKKKL